MFKVAVVYDSGKRYIFDFDLVIKTLKLKPEDLKKLEAVLKKEIQKQ